MSHPERARRLADQPAEQRTRGAQRQSATPVQAILALQASAGNRAVTAQLHRYYTKPGATRASGQPTNLKKEPMEGWEENGEEPKGAFLVQEGEKWYRFNENRKWSPHPGPTKAKADTPEEGAAEGGTPEGGPPETEPSGAIVPARRETPPVTPEEALPLVFGYLTGSQLVAMRAVSRFFYTHGSTALREYLRRTMPANLTSLSSLRPKSFIQQYHDAIAERPPEQLVIALHQANRGTVQAILDGFAGAVKIYTGEPPTGRGPAEHEYESVAGPMDDENSKMHNKAGVGSGEVGHPELTGRPQFLLSGSPNLSDNAMKNNTESAVRVRFGGIAKMYQEYIDLIRENKTEDADFTQRLKRHNASGVVPIRAALAPFVNIGETMNAELAGADEVLVRMYLVGHTKVGDPVDTLCALAKAGATVSVIVDHTAAAGTLYVRQALAKLQAAGVNVSAEKSKNRGAIMHDKLVFAHHKEQRAAPEKVGQPGKVTKEERWTVMVGSSGLTKNVINDANYENLLIIDDKKLFGELMAHSNLGATRRTSGIPELDPRSPLGASHAKLLELIPNRASPPVKQSVVKKALRGQLSMGVEDAMEMLGMQKREAGDGSKAKVIGYF